MCVCVCVCVRSSFVSRTFPRLLLTDRVKWSTLLVSVVGKETTSFFVSFYFLWPNFYCFFFSFLSFWKRIRRHLATNRPRGQRALGFLTFFRSPIKKKIKLKNLKKNVFLASESTVHSSLNKKRWVATVPKIAEKKILYIFLLDSKSLEGNSKKTRKSKWKTELFVELNSVFLFGLHFEVIE